MASEPKPPVRPDKELSPRQLAAQARAESEAAERRRERTIRLVLALVVLVVVAGLVAVGFFSGRAKENRTAGPTANPAAALPAGVEQGTYGVKYGTGWTAANADKLPTLELWEDFQCPACASLERSVGDQIRALADGGAVKLMYRPATFLDQNLAAANQANGTPNSSARATSAWGCAVDAGKAGAYHSEVFANQPTTEGAGYTDQQLTDFGSAVGISGAALTTFTRCVDTGTYLGWAANSQQKFEESTATATPTAFLNGAKLSGNDLFDIAALKQKIAAATTQ